MISSLVQTLANAILPYVESGIPVILGLNIGGSLGHAVTVIGRVFAKQESPTNQAQSTMSPPTLFTTTRAGPYMTLPVDTGCQRYVFLR